MSSPYLEKLKKAIDRAYQTTHFDCQKIFNHGIKLGLTTFNPAAVLEISGAGGQEEGRERWLTVDELQIVLDVLRAHSKQFCRENYLAFALLLVTALRKSELIEAPWQEFDLKNRLSSLDCGVVSEAKVANPADKAFLESART